MQTRKILASFLIAIAFVSSSLAAQTIKPKAHYVEVVIETALGEIVLHVYDKQAPKTSAYFLDLVEQGSYDQGHFYRSASFANNDSTSDSNQTSQRLVQGGLLYHALNSNQSPNVKDGALPILEEVETTNVTGLKHEYATVSLARDLLDTGFVIPELFICLSDSPVFDFNGGHPFDDQGFPAFAKVVKGMKIVEQIAEQDTKGEVKIEILKGQILSKPIEIMKVYVR